MSGPHTLVTGFPKLLARRLATALFAAEAGRLTLLVREQDAEEARAFALALDPGSAGRVEVLAGEVANLHLGLSTGEYRALSQSATDIVHVAELSQLSAPKSELWEVNVEGTRAVLELASDCPALRRLTHVSTVFVAGDRTGVVAEDELAFEQSFRNEYEHTRFEAELLVRRAMGELPCTILRPAIVVGDSRTGEIDRFEGPYSIAILLVTSPASVAVPLPSDGVAPLNVVPIDFVAAAGAALHRDPRAAGRTFHLVDPNPSSARRVWELVAQRTGRKLPRLSLGSRLTDAILKLPGLERLTRDQRTAIAYVNQLTFFSSRNTHELLDGTGIRCPHIESYLDLLIEYVRTEYRRRRGPETPAAPSPGFD
ncbi:MAG: SDR family oxidoreductase [Myxococcales bacterium]